MNTQILGNFSPGLSPFATTGMNQSFGGTIQIELGGLTPGSGMNNHDLATIELIGGTSLAIAPFGGFQPQFVVMTWQAGLLGRFDQVLLDAFYTAKGVDFTLAYNSPSGTGNLTLMAVPEPTMFAVLFVGWLAGKPRLRRR